MPYHGIHWDPIPLTTARIRSSFKIGSCPIPANPALASLRASSDGGAKALAKMEFY